MEIPPISIVLLDDDPGFRRSMQLLLHGRGLNVRSFANADLLIDDVIVRDPACLVTDYRMMGPNGLEVLAVLRAAGWRRGAVLVTAYGSEELVRDAIAQGFDAVIDKPCRHPILVNAVFGAAMRGLEP